MEPAVKRVCLLGAESTGKTTLARGARRGATRRCGTPNTAGRTPSVGGRQTHRGRARVRRTSRACTAGTRTSSPARPPGAVLRHGRLHDGCLPRGLSRRADERLRRSRRAALRLVPRLRARRAMAPTMASGSSRSSAIGCTSAISSGRARAGRRGCCSRGRVDDAPRSGAPVRRWPLTANDIAGERGAQGVT